jgi:ArsR family transcriptional regulator
MREAGLLSQRRIGRWVHYRIASQVPVWAHRILVSMADGIEGGRPYTEDRNRLAAMPNRPQRSGKPVSLPLAAGKRSAGAGIRA